MATLTKANNTTNLDLAASWSPAQVPTASDSIVFDSTYDSATGTLLYSGGLVSASAFNFGAITTPAALTLNQSNVLTPAGTSLSYPWEVESFDFSAAASNLTVRGGMTAPDGTLDVALAPGYVLQLNPSASNVTASFALTTGVPRLSLLAPPSSSLTTNYTASSIAPYNVVTVGATEDATITTGGYANAASFMTFTAKITGHPTLPTAVTIEAPTATAGAMLAGEGLNNTVNAIAQAGTGEFYFGGAFDGNGTGTTTTSFARFVSYDASTQKIGTVGFGVGSFSSNPVNALAKDASGDLYVGGAFGASINVQLAGSNNNFCKWDATNRVWVDLGNGLNSTVNAIDVAPDGKVYVGGAFSATTDGLSVARLASFDPSTNTYAAMGAGAPGGSVSGIKAVSSDAVYVAATAVVGGTTSYFAKWTPSTSTWSVAGGSNITTSLSSLAYDATNNRIYVGGGAGAIWQLDVATNTLTALTIPGAAGTVFSLSVNPVNGKLYVGFAASPFFIEYDPATTTWTTVPGISGLTGAIYPTSLYSDASGAVWVGTNGAFTLTGIGTATRLAKYVPATTTWSRVSYPVQANWGIITVTQSSVNYLYSGTSPTGTPIAIHGTGTKTYTLAPGSDLTIWNRQLAVEGTTIRVRRGGALLERPAYVGQDGVTVTANERGNLVYTGDVATLANTNWAGTVSASYAVQSSADSFSLLTPPGGNQSRNVTLNASGSSLRLAGSAQFAGSTGAASISTSPLSGNSLISVNTIGIINLRAISSCWGSPLPVGAPREMGGSFTLGASVSLASPYFRANDSFIIDPALPSLSTANTAFLSGPANSIIEWTSPSDVVLGGTLAEWRISDFSTLSYLGPAKYFYTGASALSLSKSILGNNNTVLMESGSGALTYNCSLAAQGSTFASVTQTLISYIMAYNSADNVITSDFAPVNRNYLQVYLGGTGSHRITRKNWASLVIQHGAQVTVDFSDAGAPATDMLLTSGTQLIAQGAGSLTLKGKPGQVTSQFISGQIRTDGTGTIAGDSYLTLNQNTATSLDFNVVDIFTTRAYTGLYVSGLGASATVSQRTPPAAINGLQIGVNGSLVLLGASGDANWMVGGAGPITPYAAYTALPTTGGTATVAYSVTGSQTQSGNTTGYVIKAIPTSNAQSFNHTGYTLTATAFMLTGNQGGTYDLVGTMNSAFTFSPAFIANTSTSELRILTQLNAGSEVTLSGPGVISLGSPSITYVSSATVAPRYLNAVETRIYAGTDNVTPSITTTTTNNRPQIWVGQGATLRLLGAGTGRTLAEGVVLQPNATLAVDEDWTVATVIGFGLTSTGNIDQRMTVNVAAGKTLTVSRWTGSDPQYGAPTMFTSSIINRYIKKGTGALRYRNMPYSTSSTSMPLIRIEAGSIEFNLIDPAVIPQGYVSLTGPLELLTGTSCSLNSSVSHEFPFVLFGAGSVTKSNTGTVYVRAYNSFTGGLTISAGEFDAQYRQAVGDGNVTVSGGVLRASAVDEDQYALEVAGNLVFSGGSLALGAAYVV
jgi:autotransporter-associated beta strand protein